jgi:Endonuclease/Exonuclease/phosphatase family
VRGQFFMTRGVCRTSGAGRNRFFRSPLFLRDTGRRLTRRAGRHVYVERVKLRWLLLGLLVVILVVPAGALTVARVVQPPGGAWVRLVAFTPYAFMLYVAALVLLALAWARAGGRWRHVARAFALVAVAGAVMHGSWLAPAYVGSTVAAPAGRPWRVMTANLMLGQASPSRVVELAVGEDVDVLVLQEVDGRALSRMRAAGLDDALAHSAGAPAAGAAGTVVLARRPLRDVTALDTGFGGYRLEVDGVTLLAVHPRPPPVTCRTGSRTIARSAARRRRAMRRR